MCGLRLHPGGSVCDGWHRLRSYWLQKVGSAEVLGVLPLRGGQGWLNRCHMRWHRVEEVTRCSCALRAALTSKAVSAGWAWRMTRILGEAGGS